MANSLVPSIPKPDPARANANALAEALATQKFMAGIKDAKQTALERGLSRTAVGPEGPEATGALRKLAGENVGAAKSLQDVLSAMSDSERDQEEFRIKALGKAALGVLSANEEDKPFLYEQGLAIAKEQGFDISQFPAQYTKELDPQLQAIVGQAQTVAQATAAFDKKRDLELDLAGQKEQIVKLTKALQKARADGDTQLAANIQDRIDKLNAVTGTTEFDPGGRRPPTKANITRSQRAIDDGDFTLAITQELRDVMSSKNLGAVGDVRLFFQGVGQQFQAFGDAIIDHAIEHGNDELNLGVLFTLDENLSGQDFLENVLAYRLALANNPDGRISDPDFRAAKESLGFDRTFTGAGDVGARLDRMDSLVRKQQNIARRRLGQKPLPLKPEKKGADKIPVSPGTPEGAIIRNKDGVEMKAVKGFWEIIN
jgi:hypothetical protein